MNAFDDLKVLDFAWVLAGPQVTRCLADFGATVIKIESHTYPDMLRTMGPYKDDKPGFNSSGYFANFNCNKYGMSLNLSQPKAIEVAKKLVSWADVIIENFQPGMIERWGLSYKDVIKIKPDIIYMSLSLHGQTGPDSAVPGFGLVAESMSGLEDLSGWPDRLPSMTQYVWGDAIIPRFALVALLSAIDHRRKTGKGQWIDICQLEVLTYLLGRSVLEFSGNGRKLSRIGNRSDYASPNGVYPCKGNDAWCAISVTTDEEWLSFCQAIGKPELAKNPKFITFQQRKANEDELDQLISQWTITLTPEEVMRLLQENGVPSGAVLNGEDLAEDPQLQHRGLWSIDHPEIGKFRHDTWGFQLSATPAQARMPAPLLGEHNNYVCSQILNMSEDEFIEALNEGVFD